jgi:hypothetical protein
LRSRGKRVSVYSIDAVIAFELRNAVGTNYVDFWAIRSEVERIEESAPAPPPVPMSPQPVHNTAAVLSSVTPPSTHALDDATSADAAASLTDSGTTRATGKPGV